MRSLNTTFVALIAAAVVAGCSPQTADNESYSVEETEGYEEEMASHDVGAIEAETWIDDATLGTRVNLDGSVPDEAETDDFAVGDPVYVSLKVDDAPTGAAVKVVWQGPEENRLTEQEKTVEAGQEYLFFEAGDTAAWSPGEYSVAVWVGDERVVEEEFEIGQQLAEAR